MKINSCVYVVLLVYSFQYYVSADKYSALFQRKMEDELIDLIEKTQYKVPINYDETSQTLEYDVDPDDRVDIEIWNKLNEADIKKMSQITDYSNESAAILWLKWYLRVLERYHQVCV